MKFTSASGGHVTHAVLYDASKPRGWRRIVRWVTRDRWPSPIIATMEFKGSTTISFDDNGDLTLIRRDAEGRGYPPEPV